VTDGAGGRRGVAQRSARSPGPFYDRPRLGGMTAFNGRCRRKTGDGTASAGDGHKSGTDRSPLQAAAKRGLRNLLAIKAESRSDGISPQEMRDPKTRNPSFENGAKL
jgi:hypothetical protein